MYLPIPGIGELRERFAPYTLPILLGSLSLFCIAIALIYLYQTSQTHDSIEFVIGESTTSADLQTQNLMTIDVEGAVHHPGVYSLKIGSRMEDVIQAAGGFSSEASQSLIEKSINRAAKVSDGAKVYIPKKSDEVTSHNVKSEGEEGISETSHNMLSEQTGSQTISINSSSQSELESLPGVGPATAVKIIKARPFTNLEELVSKKAVGQKLFDKLKSELSL